MTSRHLAGCALALAPWAAGVAMAADGLVYKCVEPNGSVLFTDSNRSGCKALELPGAIAAPPARAAAPPRPAAPAVSPANFPRVDGAAQRARDSDRREILEEELRGEEKKLGALKAEFNKGEPERNGNERNYAKYQERVAEMRDAIARTEKNIEALKREIANIK